MAEKAHSQQGQSWRNTTGRLRHSVQKDAQPLALFWTKFNNDWSWNHAAGLAYNLLLAMFPLVIAMLAMLGFFLGRLDPSGYNTLIGRMGQILPAVTSSQSIIKPALRQLTKDSGILSLFAFVFAIFNGSRLFLFIEGCFDIIYHARPRGIIAQNAVAVLMLLIFAVLVPIMIVTSAVPALVVSLLQKTALGQLPGGGFIAGLSGIVGSLIASYMLFQAIYMIVPHQKISFRNSWLGSLVAATLLELYLALFPLYVTYFLGSFAGALGLLILLIFFYYFAMILFLGAEVNAFFAEGIRNTPYDLATMVHLVTRRLAASELDVTEQASVDHEKKVPKELHPQDAQNMQVEEATQKSTSSLSTDGKSGALNT